MAVAKKVRPLVKQLDAAYEANNVLLAYQLKDQLAAELALYDPYLARAYDGEAQRGLLKTARDYLTSHKSHCKDFWKRCRDLEEPFYLIIAGGATEFEPSKPPRPLLVMGSLVNPGEVSFSRYKLKKESSSAHVIRALASPLTRMMAGLLRNNHPEGTLEDFFAVETPAKIVSMVKASMMSGSALFGGRLIKCVAVPGQLDQTGQPDFSKAFWTEREGSHALHVSPPVRQLFDEAIDIDEKPPRVVLELRSRVEALSQEGAASIAAHVVSINDHRQAVAERLEASRADGDGQPLLVVAYLSYDARRRNISKLAEPEKTEAKKLLFRDFDALELSLADHGVEVIVETREGKQEVALGALDNCAVAVVPDGTIFDERGVRENSFPDGITALARRGLLFTESGIMRFVANPDLLKDLFDKRVDPDRVFIYVDEDAREVVRSVGTAEILPQRRGHGRGQRNTSFVKFNSEAVIMGSDDVPRPRFRSAQAEQAERDEARRAKKAEPLQELSGPSYKGHATGSFARKPRRDFQTELLDEDDFPIWSAVRALAEEWRAEVVIFDEWAAQKKKYDVKWGGHAESAASDFNKVLKCGMNVDKVRLRGGELMRHFVKELDKTIKKNEPDSLQ